VPAPEDVGQRHPVDLLGAAAHAALHLGAAAAPCSSRPRLLGYRSHSSVIPTHSVLTASCSGCVAAHACLVHLRRRGPAGLGGPPARRLRGRAPASARAGCRTASTRPSRCRGETQDDTTSAHCVHRRLITGRNIVYELGAASLCRASACGVLQQRGGPPGGAARL
jgi:hypothetical protein